jgi:hypothetical protein
LLPEKDSTKAVASSRSSHRERGELEGGDPALRGLFERRDVLCRKREPHHVSQESGGFVGGEAQVGGLDLGHLISGPESREGEGRIGCA